MTTVLLKVHLTQLVIEASEKEAIDILINWTGKNDDDLNNQTIQLAARYNRLQKDIMQGVMDSRDIDVAKAKLNITLSYLINALPKNAIIQIEEKRQIVPVISSSQPVSSPTPPATVVKKIIFFAANPFDTGRLNLKEEYAEIARQLEDKSARDRLEITSDFCTDLEGFQEKTNTFRPNIIHFAGHGSDSKGEVAELASRGIGHIVENKDTGLIFHQSGYGAAMVVNDDTLDYNFETFIEEKIPIEVLVLNACYSSNQADLLSKRIKYVVGVHNSIADGASIDFSAGFYYGLADGKSVESAFRYGKGRAMPKLTNRNHIILYIDGVVSTL